MDNPDKNAVYENTTFGMVGRLLAAAAAVALSFLLYRFAKAYYSYRERPNSRRSRGSRRGIPIFGGGRKDVLYAALSERGYEDEDDEEGGAYRDDDLDDPPRGSINLNASRLDRPLPELPESNKQDKPLPPLPRSDFEPE
jgi:hypothetical protein